MIVAGDDIGRMSETQRAAWRSRTVGFIFQFYNLMPVLTAAENVELPLLLTSLGRKERVRRVEVALRLVDLSDRMERLDDGDCVPRDEPSGPLASFIRGLGTVIAVFFAFGATLGAMITMYAQVASRVREVGTLRALGFKRRSVLGSFLVESLVLALLGAIAGCLFASLLGTVSFSTVNFSSFTEIKFRFHFGPGVAIWSTVFAVAMGLLGGFLPAARAARLQIAEATKG